MKLPPKTRKAFIHLARLYETTGLEKIREACMWCVGKCGNVYGELVAGYLIGVGNENTCHLCTNLGAGCENCWKLINGDFCREGINRETLEAVLEANTPDLIRKAFIARAKHIRAEIAKYEAR